MKLPNQYTNSPRELGSVCDRGVCEALFQLLAEHTESSNKYELSSSLIARAISSASNYGQQYISGEEFVISALDTYVDMLQTPPWGGVQFKIVF